MVSDILGHPVYDVHLQVAGEIYQNSQKNFTDYPLKKKLPKEINDIMWPFTLIYCEEKK